MDVGRPFKAIFKDPRWVSKMLLQGLLTLVPIVNFATSGYVLQYEKNVAYGRDEQLPEWSDFGKHWVAGFLVFVAGLIYALPLIVIIMLGVALIVGGAVSGQEETTAMGILCGTMLIMVVSIVYGLALAVIMPAAMTNYNLRREFGDFFRIGEIWGHIKDNAGAYFGAYGMGFVVNFAVSFITTPIIYVFMALGGVVMAISVQAGGEGAGAAGGVCGFFLLTMVGYLVLVLLYVPVAFIWYHYFGQYMAKAYGLPGVTPAPAAAAYGGGYGSGDVLPPPPPSGTAQAPPSPPQSAPPAAPDTGASGTGAVPAPGTSDEA